MRWRFRWEQCTFTKEFTESCTDKACFTTDKTSDFALMFWIAYRCLFPECLKMFQGLQVWISKLSSIRTEIKDSFVCGSIERDH